MILKRLVLFAVAGVALVAGTACAKESEQEVRTQDIVVLYTNDIHCAVEAGMGYSGLVALKEEYEAQGAKVILVDCGDAIQGEPIGTLSKGEYIIDIMNEVGYDVATLGNHEFDYGSERLLELSEKAEFTYVSCNFERIDGGHVFEPYKMIEADGLNIAFVGISTPYTLTSSAPSYFQNENGEFIYSFNQDETGERLYEEVQNAIDEAKADGADYIIAISHLGYTMDCSPWTSIEVVENTVGIDVIMDGHSHSEVPCERIKDEAGNWVLVSQTGSKYNSVGMLLLEQNGSISTGLIKDYEEKDPDITAFIDNIQSQYEAELQKVVATSKVDLTTKNPETGERMVRNSETNLGDLCADAYRLITGADLSFVNGGGIREDIAKGEITYEDILKVHPFGNAVCVVEATGQEILDSLELGSINYPLEDGSFLHVSGITYEIHKNVPTSVKLDENGMFVGVEGEYRVKNVTVGGESLDLDKTYVLACHDYYIKNAGGGFNMFLDNNLLQDCVMLDNQILIEYITEYLSGVVGEEYANPFGQGRITIIE